MNYYNDNDKFIVKWLKELIKAELIPPGHVDGRSIHEVTPDDIKGYTQKHFFAGIAGWPRALELAGWDTTWPVWTASLPCQPLSVAGQKRGEKDERHLWPAFFKLVRECRPTVILGEQVTSKDGREWLSGIQTDMETLGYRCAAADLPAASVGAPHKRNRLFWVAHCQQSRLERHTGNAAEGNKPGWNGTQPNRSITKSSSTNRLADSDDDNRRTRISGTQTGIRTEGSRRRRSASGGFWHNSVAIPCADGKWRRVPSETMANPERIGLQKPGQVEGCSSEASGGVNGMADSEYASTARQRKYGRQPTHKPESKGAGTFNAKCKFEIEPALFPLADGFSNRMGTLRGAGNAIVPQVAAVFISAIMDILNEN